MNEPLERCLKLERLLANGKITFEEFAYAAMLIIVNASEVEREECVEGMSAAFVSRFRDYLSEKLESADFMPSAVPFLTSNDEATAEQKRRELRPRYVHLFQLVCERVSHRHS